MWPPFSAAIGSHNTRCVVFETERPAFDLLTGSDRARRLILEGAPPEDVVAEVAPVAPELRELVTEAETRLARAQA